MGTFTLLGGASNIFGTPFQFGKPIRFDGKAERDYSSSGPADPTASILYYGHGYAPAVSSHGHHWDFVSPQFRPNYAPLPPPRATRLDAPKHSHRPAGCACDDRCIEPTPGPGQYDIPSGHTGPAWYESLNTTMMMVMIILRYYHSGTTVMRTTLTHRRSILS